MHARQFSFPPFVAKSATSAVLRLAATGAAILAVGMLSAPEALAERRDRKDPFDRTGFYAGVSGVYVHNPFEGELEDILNDELDVSQDVDVDIDDSEGVNGRIGYRAASWFALELEYEWINSYGVDLASDFGAPIGNVSGNLYEIEGHVLTANTKWIIPFWRIQPFLLIGAGYSFYDVDKGPVADPLALVDDDLDVQGGNQNGPAGRAGLGIDFYLTESIVVSTEVTAVVTAEDFSTPDGDNIDDLNYLSASAGLQYRF